MSTISTIRENYTYVPNDLLDLLDISIKYYESKNNLPEDSVNINVVYGNGGSTNSKGHPNYIVTIPNGSGGKVSVNSVDGNGNNTFLTYDEETAFVHELGHVIQSLIGGNGDIELNNAILKSAVDATKQITGKTILADYEQFIATLKYILDFEAEANDFDYIEDYDDSLIWNQTKKLNIARGSSSASYENYYNTVERNYAVDSGLSNINKLYRTGYLSHEDVGAQDEWTGFGDGTDGTTVSGNYKNLLATGQAVDFLGNKYDNTLEGSTVANANDYLDGGHGNDTLVGNGGDDTLVGGQEMDNLQGGADNDYLYGGKKNANGYSSDDVKTDFLIGGSGFDTYYSNQKDIISDSDGSGKIYFDNDLLSGKKVAVQDTNGYMYEDSKYSYVLDNPNGVGKLTILEGTNATGFTAKEIIVNNFDATKDGGYLGIILTKKEIEITVEDSIALEGGELEFRVNINQTLDKDLVLSVDSYFSGSAESNDITMPSDKTITIKAGEKTATYKVAAVDDEKEEPTENFIFAVTGIDSSNGYEGVDAYKGNDLGAFTIKNAATATIEDNDEAGTLYVSISAVSDYEGNWDDNNQLSFVVKASRALVGEESATVDLNIYDIDTDSSDYGFLSEDSITFDSTNQQFVITLDIFGDEEVEPSERVYISPTVVSTAGGIENVLVTDVDIATIFNDDSIAEPTEGDDVIEGTDGDDVINGLGGNDTIYGKGGDDLLFGDDGEDTLYGGEENDTLIGGDKSDSLYGGAGDDFLVGDDDEYTDLLDGGEGFDTYYVGNGDIVEDSDKQGEINFLSKSLAGTTAQNSEATPNVYTAGNLTFTKSNGDLIVLDTSANQGFVINGFMSGGTQDGKSYEALGILLEDIEPNTEVGAGTGIKTIELPSGSTPEAIAAAQSNGFEVYLGNDNTHGGTKNNDTLNLGVGSDKGVGGAGSDSISSSDGGDEAYGGAGSDRIYLAGSGNYIDGGADNDTISTGSSSTVDGGTGADTISVGHNSTVNSGDGADRITAGNSATIDGGNHRDTIKTGDSANVKAGSGSDSVIVGHNSTVDLGTGNDTLSAKSGATVTGSGSNKVTTGASANISLSSGSDTISAGDNSIISAGNGSNKITAQNNSTVSAGSGSDTITAVSENSISAGNGSNSVSAGNSNSIYSGSGTDNISAGSSNVISSGGANDTISASSNNDIDSGSGNDNVSAGNDNSIYTESGSDSVNAGSNNYINTGSDNDSVTAGSFNTIYTEHGTDNVTASDNNDIETGTQNDTVKANDNNHVNTGSEDDNVTAGNSNSIYTEGGNDTVKAGDNNYINSGKDEDSVTAGNGNIIYTVSGDDSVNAVSDNIIDTGSEDDSVTVSGDNNNIRTRDGEDFVSVGGDNNDINTASENDRVDVNGSSNVVRTEDGEDIVNLTGNNNNIDTGSEDDVVNISGNTNVIKTQTGEDNIIISGDTNNIDTGSENDDIEGSTDNSTIKTQSGDDTLNLSGSNNIIETSSGKDTLEVYGNLNTIDTGSEKDDLYMSGDNNTITMGDGDDNLETYYYGINANNIIDTGAGTDTVNGRLNDSTLLTQSGEDSINLRAYRTSIDTGSENDILEIQGNSNTISTGDGNDILNISGDYNNITMGKGDDAATLYYNSDNNTVALGDGNNTLEMNDRSSNNTVTSENGNDEVVIRSANGSSNNSFDLGNGNNTVLNNERDDYTHQQSYQFTGDTYVTGNGKDTLTSGYGNDTISAGDNDDTIDAFYGTNAIDGGAGNDSYILSAENKPTAISSLKPYEAHDTITDESGIDNILFDSDIAKENIVFSLVEKDGGGVNLLINYGVKFQHSAAIEDNSIETFTMNDGTTISRETIVSALEEIATFLGKDVTAVTNEEIQEDIALKSILYHAWENEYTNTYSYNADNNNNIIIGEDYAEHIEAYSGDDIIEGNGGDDFLNGGNGDDTYIYSRGDDSDIILDRSEKTTVETNGDYYGGEGEYDRSSYYGGEGDSGSTYISWTYNPNEAPSHDTLILQDDIKKDELEFYWDSSSSNDLIVNIGYDTIRIAEYYDRRFHIEDLIVEGQRVSFANILNIMTTDDGETIRGLDWENNTIDAQAGDDAIIGGNLSDDIIAGTGNDFINGRAGDDIYRFSIGDGQDILQDTAEYYRTLHPSEEKSSADYYGGEGDPQPDIKLASFELVEGEGGRPFEYNYFEDAPTITNYGQTAGYDKVIFSKNIHVQNVGFQREGDGLYVRYGAQNDSIFLDRQYEPNPVEPAPYPTFASTTITETGHAAIEEFILDDETSITNTNLDIGLAEEAAYLEENQDYLNIMDNNDRNTEGYVNQFVLSKWNRVNKTISGTELSEKIDAGQGDDLVLAGAGNDIIDGGFGTDELRGGTGNDTYVYHRWDGADTIIDESGADTLSFGEDIYLSDLLANLDLETGTLTIALIDEVEKRKAEANGEVYNPDISTLTQSITLTEWVSQTTRIENFTFEDGKTLTAMELYNHFFSTEGDNVEYGLEGNNVINSLGGNDTIHTGSGDDILNGGSGNDTYVVGFNQGSDLVFDESGSDTVQFELDVLVSDLSVVYDNNDLVITLEGTTVTLTDWYNSENRIETFEFENGDLLDVNDILNLIATDTSDDIKGTELDDNIEAGAGDDTIIGAKGNDTLIGESGDDTYIYNLGDGNDTIIDTSGNDNISFQEGITADNISATMDTDTGSLTITFNDSPTDSITIENWSDADTRVENFTFTDGSTLTAMELYNLLIPSDGNDTLLGIEGDNIIDAQAGDDTVTTGSGDDYIDGNTGNDTLDGGMGDDTLVGGEDNDSYVVGKNSGNDVVIDVQGDEDSLVFKDGVTPSDLSVVYDNNDLVVTLEGTTVVLTDWYNAENRIETFEFENGDVLNVNDIINLMATDANDNIKGTELDEDIKMGDGDDTYNFGINDGNDTIIDIQGNDTIAFKENISIDNLTAQIDSVTGNLTISIIGTTDSLTIQNWTDLDTRVENFTFTDGTTLSAMELYNLLIPSEGNDTLYGIQGDNTIEAQAGNDTINTGSGDDILMGGEGDDSYVVGTNSGNDVIIDVQGTNDALVFEDGITASDISVNYNDNDLVITLQGTTVTLTDWYNSENRIETFEFENGDLLDVNDILNLIATDANDDIKGTELDDNIEAGSGDDIITGAKGDDTLAGESGDDTYIYNLGDGNDTIIDTSGNDTISFQEGITADNISATMDPDTGNLTITFNDSPADSITIQNWSNIDTRVETFTFEDGTTLTAQELYDTVLITNGDDEIVGINDDNVIDALDGEDIVTTGAGNDILTGGAGNDILAAGNGDDVYIFGLGDGNDEIYDTGGNDTLSLTDNISIDDLIFSAEGKDLIITLEDGSSTTIIDWQNTDNRIENIVDESGASVLVETLIRPQVVDYNLNILEDKAFTGTIQVTDNSNTALVYTLSKEPQNGSVIIDAQTGETTYTPNENYYGTDSIEITVTNGYGQSATSTVNFDIEAVNDAPTIAKEVEDINLVNSHDANGQIEVNDVEGDSLNFNIVTQPTHGTISIDENGNWDYKADPSYNGNDSVVVGIDDGNGGISTTTLNFRIDGYSYEGGDLVITDNGQDTLMMDGINKHELDFSKVANNMVINIKDQGSITLTDYFVDTTSGVQTITTAQGDINLGKDVIKTVEDGGWFSPDEAEGNEGVSNLLIGVNDDADLIGKSDADILFAGNDGDDLIGYAGNDLLVGGSDWDDLYGGSGNDTLYGQAGWDRLYGEDGNDALMGESGNDYLVGGAGDDFLSGGSGNDRLEGGEGNDTYMFEKGDNHATITDHKSSGFFGFGSEDAGVDVVQFGKGITKDDVSFVMSFGDLYLQYGDDDSVKINNQDENKDKIETFKLEDGSYLTHDDVNLVIQQLNAYASDKGMWAYNNDTVRNNQEMMNIVSSAWNV